MTPHWYQEQLPSVQSHTMLHRSPQTHTPNVNTPQHQDPKLLICFFLCFITLERLLPVLSAFIFMNILHCPGHLALFEIFLFQRIQFLKWFIFLLKLILSLLKLLVFCLFVCFCYLFYITLILHPASLSNRETLPISPFPLH